MIILFQSVVLIIIIYGTETVTKELEFRGVLMNASLNPCSRLEG